MIDKVLIDKVLIVGGGLAGLALARALHRLGMGVEVVERVPEWRPAGTGLYLPANGVRALDDLGLGEAAVARARVIPRQRTLDHRGRVLVDVDLAALWDGLGPCIALPRSDLHEVLLAGAAGVPLRLGTTVTAVADRGGHCDVTFDDGSTRGYDLVVGADGIDSSVRRLVFGGAGPRPVGQVCWRFVADGFPEVTCWTAALGRGRTFLTVPLGGGRVYCYADVAADRPDDPTDGTVAGFRALFAGFAEPVGRILSTLGAATPYFSAIEEVVQEPSSRGRVVLVGDAAHACSPNMAEGASMAFEDAVVLADCLAGDGPVDRRLAAFEARRAPRVTWVREQTHRRDRLRGLPTALRDLALRVAGQRVFRANYAPLKSAP
jgi:2-polyprenyl-6-methoxyphenol hydroxylase-like FAD-dependent oxidoreductase